MMVSKVKTCEKLRKETFTIYKKVGKEYRGKEWVGVERVILDGWDFMDIFRNLQDYMAVQYEAYYDYSYYDDHYFDCDDIRYWVENVS